MRADRLIALVMLLQARGRLTAATLARELEVSERTVYRDVDALCTAGVPIYSQSGPDGGFALMDRYRTTLTGLTDAEVRALFLGSTPAPLADLGLDAELTSALRKLAAALPAPRRDHARQARQRFLLDPTWWQQTQGPPRYLHAVQKAVWEDRRLQIRYRTPVGVDLRRTVEPYGLVAKAGVWYLVSARDGRFRVHRLANLLQVEETQDSFQRSDAFDLLRFWNQWCRETEGLLSSFRVGVRATAHVAPQLTRHLTPGAQPGGRDGEWSRLDLAFESFEEARETLLGYGSSVEVVEPRALRIAIQDYARQILGLYTGVAPTP